MSEQTPKEPRKHKTVNRLTYYPADVFEEYNKTCMLNNCSMNGTTIELVKAFIKKNKPKTK